MFSQAGKQLRKLWYILVDEQAIRIARRGLTIALQNLYGLESDQLANILSWSRYENFIPHRIDRFTVYVVFSITIPSPGVTKPFNASVELARNGTRERWRVVRVESAPIYIDDMLSWFVGFFDNKGYIEGKVMTYGNFLENLPLAIPSAKRKIKPSENA